jgi:circadian clock protein KaiC
MRYASINGQLRKVMMVVKMRRSQHSIDMCAYEVTSKGLVIGEPMRGYRALTSGIPGPWSLESGQNEPELNRPSADRPSRKKSLPRPRKPQKP